MFKLSYPFKLERILWSPCTWLLPLWRLHCFHTVYHKDGISVLRTDRSQSKYNRRILGMRKDFKSTFSRSSHGNLWQVGRSVILQIQSVKFGILQLSFPCLFVATSICLQNMHRLSNDHAQDNQSWSPLDYLKDWGYHHPCRMNTFQFLWGSELGCFHWFLCTFDSDSKWWIHVFSWVTTRSIKLLGSSS